MLLEIFFELLKGRQQKNKNRRQKMDAKISQAPSKEIVTWETIVDILTIAGKIDKRDKVKIYDIRDAYSYVTGVPTSLLTLTSRKIKKEG
jgi:hypothetical protein